MSKKCMTLIACPFERHCVHRQTAPATSNQFFQPPHVGEACPHYELATTAYDYHDEVMAKMGAHQ